MFGDGLGICSVRISSKKAYPSMTSAHLRKMVVPVGATADISSIASSEERFVAVHSCSKTVNYLRSVSQVRKYHCSAIILPFPIPVSQL